MIEHDLTSGVLELSRVRLLLNGGLRVEDLEDALSCRLRPSELVDDEANLPHWLLNQPQIEDAGRQLSHAQLPLEHKMTAVVDGDDDSKGPDADHRRHIEGLNLIGMERIVEQRVRRAFELGALIV